MRIIPFKLVGIGSFLPLIFSFSSYDFISSLTYRAFLALEELVEMNMNSVFTKWGKQSPPFTFFQVFVLPMVLWSLPLLTSLLF